MAVFRSYPYPATQQRRALSPALLSGGAGGWHATTQEEPFVERRRNITLAATGGEGYVGLSLDGTTWTWYAGPLASDGRTLTAVASEAAAQAAPALLPANGRWDLPAMAQARFVKLGHRSTGGSYTVREFYARRLVQTDDFEAESVTTLALRAGAVTADKITVAQLSAISADLGTVTAGVLDGVTIYAGGTGHPLTIDTNGITIVSAASSVYDAGRSVTWKDATGANITAIRAYYGGPTNSLDLTAYNASSRPGEVSILAAGTRNATILLDGGSATSYAYYTADRIEIRSSKAAEGIYFYSNGAVLPDVLITTSGLAVNVATSLQRLDTYDDANIRGNITTGTTTAATDAFIELGGNGSGNRNAYIDLHGDGTYTDYGARFIRKNTGANANTEIAHRGTGSLNLVAIDAGTVGFFTNSILRMTVTSGGAFDIPEISTPAAPAADNARLFVRDNGAGKTQVCVIFNTGAVQVIATQP